MLTGFHGLHVCLGTIFLIVLLFRIAKDHFSPKNHFWNWPPYFKFDTANLYTEANDAISTKDDPEWVRIMHYGWRSELLSSFPNAVSISAAAGPDDKPINWISITILVLLAAIFWAIFVRLRRFKRNRLDPMFENVEDGFYAAGDAIDDRTRGVRRWFGRKSK